jgi:uncharacterized protein (TIGR02145 family)
MKNHANNLAMLLMALAIAFTFFACEEKGKKAEGGEAAVQRVEAEAPKAAEAEASKPSDGSAFTDARDGKIYKTAKIGEQTWMAENLSYKTENSWCYGDDEANCKKYGRLYEWFAAREACPKSWHLPSWEELGALTEYAGGDNSAGKKLKSKSGWKDKDNGTDDYGFSALPGGIRKHSYDDNATSYIHAGDSCYLWSSTLDGEDYALAKLLANGDNISISGGTDSGFGYSVRCIKD